MKTILSLLLAAALVPVTLAGGSPARGTGLAGTWTVDTSRLPMPAEARPRSVTITFAAADDGHWSTTVVVVDAQGTTLRAEGTTPLDGTPTPVTGNFEADVAATRMPAPGVLVMQLSQGGVPGSTRIYTLLADGQSMIETAANFGDNGQPVMRTNYFRRLK